MSLKPFTALGHNQRRASKARKGAGLGRLKEGFLAQHSPTAMDVGRLRTCKNADSASMFRADFGQLDCEHKPENHKHPIYASTPFN
eukprot:12587924-Alexandrium_andersonii.AAC.1